MVLIEFNTNMLIPLNYMESMLRKLVGFFFFFTLAVTVILSSFVVVNINFFINSSETKTPRQKNYTSVTKYCISITKTENTGFWGRGVRHHM